MRITLIPATVGFALLIGGVGSASAGLIDRGNGLIYDDDLNITWLADANYAATSGYAADNAVDLGSSATNNIFANGRMGWSAANTWAGDLVYEGYDDWRLFDADPNCGYAAYNCATNDLGDLFYNELGVTQGSSINSSTDTDLALFDNVQSYYYWSGTEHPFIANEAWVFDTNDGFQTSSYKGNEFYAWAVRSGDVAAATVPEPGTMLLLAAGLIGVAGVKRRRC